MQQLVPQTVVAVPCSNLANLKLIPVSKESLFYFILLLILTSQIICLQKKLFILSFGFLTLKTKNIWIIKLICVQGYIFTALNKDHVLNPKFARLKHYPI